MSQMYNTIHYIKVDTVQFSCKIELSLLRLVWSAILVLLVYKAATTWGVVSDSQTSLASPHSILGLEKNALWFIGISLN